MCSLHVKSCKSMTLARQGFHLMTWIFCFRNVQNLLSNFEYAALVESVANIHTPTAHVAR